MERQIGKSRQLPSLMDAVEMAISFPEDIERFKKADDTLVAKWVLEGLAKIETAHGVDGLTPEQSYMLASRLKTHPYSSITKPEWDVFVNEVCFEKSFKFNVPFIWECFTKFWERRLDVYSRKNAKKEIHPHSNVVAQFIAKNLRPVFDRENKSMNNMEKLRDPQFKIRKLEMLIESGVGFTGKSIPPDRIEELKKQLEELKND